MGRTFNHRFGDQICVPLLHVQGRCLQSNVRPYQNLSTKTPILCLNVAPKMSYPPLFKALEA
jgi:hypothetical protein